MSYTPIWFMVIASLIATIGIAFTFKQSMLTIQSEVDRDPLGASHHLLDKQRTSFLVKACLVEALPMILIVIGFMQALDSDIILDPSELALPILLIIGALGASVFTIWTSLNQTLTHPHISEHSMIGGVRVFAFLAIGLLGAIPIMSIFFMFFILA